MDWLVPMRNIDTNILLSKLRIIMVDLGDLPHIDAPLNIGGLTNGGILARLKELDIEATEREDTDGTERG